ncbi:MAG: MaoC family dehydratase N-terminal domain-containing protein [Demequinaceae bacterium]|nr:MaoC family dehydratase N-terminal domain-containing protein [Demequinaceae bacterium]
MSREKIREFADAVDARGAEHRDVDTAVAAGYPDLVAPSTFAVLIAQRSEFAVLIAPEVGVELSKVIHAEERFIHHRPIVAGDVIETVIHIESMVPRSAILMVTTRAELTDAAGAPVSTAFSILAVREYS